MNSTAAGTASRRAPWQRLRVSWAWYAFAAAVGWALVPMTSDAVVEIFAFESPEQEVRYKELVAELRCPKCLNTNLAGSNGPVAGDLRREVYEQLRAGRSDEAIRRFMQERYGDFILYRPPVNGRTLLLWGLPPVMLAIGALVIVITIRRQRRRQAAGAMVELSAQELARADELLADRRH